MEVEMWQVFDLNTSEMNSTDVIEYFRCRLTPFSDEYWSEAGEVVLQLSNAEKGKVSLQFGYFGLDKIALSLEGCDPKLEPEHWGFCADPDGLVSGEIFYTKNDIFFPTMSVVSAETTFEVLKEFVADPFVLPKSVLWTNDEEINWPEKL